MPFFQKKWYSIVNAGFYSYIVENIINPLIFYAMKNILVKIGVLCSLIFCISFLNGCQKEELTLSNNDDVATGVTTRVLSGFHWKCPRCGFLMVVGGVHVLIWIVMESMKRLIVICF